MFGKGKLIDTIADLEHQLAQEKEITKAIGRSMAVIEFDPQGQILRANDNFLRTMGYSAAEIEGEHHSIFVAQGCAQSQEYRDFWRKLDAGQFVRGRVERINKQGETVWLEATYNPVFDRDNKVEKIVKFASDITERVLEQARNKAILDALDRSTAFIEFNPDGTVVNCNDNFARTVGYSKAEIIGQHHRIFCDPQYANSPEYNEFWQRLNRGEFVTGQFERRNKHGNTIWLEASYNPVYDDRRRLVKVVKFASDISERTRRAIEEKRSAEVAYRISEETSQTASEGAGVIIDAVSEMNKIADTVRLSSSHIESLNRQSAEISSIIATIQSIADQTNLLALNAAIEAARAGEQGRGFAVVADEVRQLAARTSQSTAEISSMISNIQQDTGKASVSMDQCLDQVTTGVELANKTGDAIAKIQEGANEVFRAIDQFSNVLEADKTLI